MGLRVRWTQFFGLREEEETMAYDVKQIFVRPASVAVSPPS